MTDPLFLARLAAGVFAAASLAFLALTVLLGMLAPFLMARRPQRRDKPPVTMVIPIKQLDESFVPSQESAFDQDYPDYDVTITAVETESPAIAASRRILAAHPEHAARIVRATASFAASPKVNNLYQAVEDARADLIVMKDSNILLTNNGMTEAVAAMTDDVGLVVAVPEAHGAKNFAAEVECSIMNQSHGRILLAAAALGLGFGVGKLMVFRRSALHKAGGFEAIAHSVGEDSAMAHALEATGLRTRFMRAPILQLLGARNFHDVFHRQLRWTVVRRHNETFAFLLEPLGLVSCCALAAGFAAPLVGLEPLAGAAAAVVVWWALETLLALARGWDVSVTAPAAMVTRDAMMLGVWLRAWFTKNVVWASEKYQAHQPDRLVENEPMAAAVETIKRNDR
ncbi:MAG: glycosyltransferase [Hyphomicrobiales bacterium]|nr:glycosyltransferase [Hyphomicrobiales bacterium]